MSLNHQEHLNAAARALGTPSAADLRTLVVCEDDPDDLALTVRALERLDICCRIVTVASAAAALEFLADNHYCGSLCLLLLDHQMPMMTGAEVIRKLRTDSRTETLPVVVFSVHEDEDSVRQCWDSGANGYIVKPCNAEQYERVLQRAVYYWLGVNYTMQTRRLRAQAQS
jgi:two-component system, response regulator